MFAGVHQPQVVFILVDSRWRCRLWKMTIKGNLAGTYNRSRRFGVVPARSKVSTSLMSLVRAARRRRDVWNFDRSSTVIRTKSTSQAVENLSACAASLHIVTVRIDVPKNPPSESPFGPCSSPRPKTCVIGKPIAIFLTSREHWLLCLALSETGRT